MTLPIQWRIQDFPLGGAEPLGGGADLQHGCFLVKTYAKTKELDPVGGGHAPAAPPPPEPLMHWFNLLECIQNPMMDLLMNFCLLYDNEMEIWTRILLIHLKTQVLKLKRYIKKNYQNCLEQ